MLDILVKHRGFGAQFLRCEAGGRVLPVIAGFPQVDCVEALDHPAIRAGLHRVLAIVLNAAECNAVRETSAFELDRPPARALTVEEFKRLRSNVVEWQKNGHASYPRSKSVVDKILILVGTGVRPGELFAFRWEDLDWSVWPPTLEVSGTVIRELGKGIHRQPYPKSVSSERILPLPLFASQVLARLYLAQDPNLANDLGLIFPSKVGTIAEPGNFSRQFRDARGEEFGWVKPSSFRKAVATIIEREASSKVAATQLGHASDAVTMRHYVQRDKLAPDSSAILDQFGSL